MDNVVHVIICFDENTNEKSILKVYEREEDALKYIHRCFICRDFSAALYGNWKYAECISGVENLFEIYREVYVDDEYLSQKIWIETWRVEDTF